MIAFYRKVKHFLGSKILLWLCLGVLGSIGISVVEFFIAGILQLFFATFGMMPMQQIDIIFFGALKPSVHTLIVMLVLVGLVKALSQFCYLQSAGNVQETLIQRLRLSLIKNILHFSKSKGIGISEALHLNGAIFQTSGLFMHATVQGLGVLIQSIILLIGMFWLAYREALISVAGLAVIFCIITLSSRRVRYWAAKVPTQNQRVAESVLRVIKNWILIKVMKIEPYEDEMTSSNIRSVSYASVMSSAWANFGSAFAPFMGINLIVLIIFVSSQYFYTASKDLFSFIYIFVRFVQGVANGVTSLGYINQYYPSMKQAYAFFTKNEIDSQRGTDRKGAITKQHHSLETLPWISMRGLSYEIDAQRKLFGHLDYEIRPGAWCGVIGPSGSGKSTLISLILGFLQPTEGEILINGLPPLVQFSGNAIPVGYVGPEPLLIAGSIRENILYGNRSVMEDDIWRSIDRADLRSTVEGLPAKLEYRISESGEGLSTGQKQRLCIARALTMFPKLLVLDEALANLDVATEQKIIGALRSDSNRMTVLIISHRETITSYCDQILQLKPS